MSSVDIAHLEFLARHEKLEHLKGLLCFPCITFWGSLSADAFSERFKNLCSLLVDAPEIQMLLELHLLTEYLLFREKAPDWMSSWLRNNINIHERLTGIGWEQAIASKWYAVPVILVLNAAYLRHFVVGLISGQTEHPVWPAWADDLMEKSAKQAIGAAAASAGALSLSPDSTTFYCYPLAVANQTIQFKGASIGLPMALGFMKLLTGAPMSNGLVATGTIEETGAILKAGHTDQKIDLARRQGFRVFLYPSLNHSAYGPARIEALPVSSLEEAFMFSCLFAPGRGEDLLLLSNMSKDAQVFANNFDNMDYNWLKWAFQHEKLDEVIHNTLSSMNLFSEFVRKFEKKLESHRLEEAELLSSFMRPDGLEKTGQIAPLATFKWHMLNMALANHRGKVAEAIEYSGLAHRLLVKARKSDLNVCATYHNHKFITLHNGYHFEPVLPDELQETLDGLKKRYDLKCQDGCTTDRTLGCLYGSIAQNYGFCGPAYLAEVENYSRLSRKAFGDGTVPELKADWLRQLNYMAYAYIDSSLFEKAEKDVFGYLEIENWDVLWPKIPELPEWHHALLARFFADTEHHAQQSRYLDRAREHKDSLVEKRHPWQLWTFNLARIAQSEGDEKTAFDLFSKSLGICLSRKAGPTVRVMALLPLSGLWRLGCLAKIDVPATENSVRQAAKELNPEYFSLLDQKDFEKVLQTVWGQPEKLFPFAYR